MADHDISLIVQWPHKYIATNTPFSQLDLVGFMAQMGQIIIYTVRSTQSVNL